MERTTPIAAEELEKQVSSVKYIDHISPAAEKRITDELDELELEFPGTTAAVIAAANGGVERLDVELSEDVAAMLDYLAWQGAGEDRSSVATSLIEEALLKSLGPGWKQLAAELRKPV